MRGPSAADTQVPSGPGMDRQWVVECKLPWDTALGRRPRMDRVLEYIQVEHALVDILDECDIR